LIPSRRPCFAFFLRDDPDEPDPRRLEELLLLVDLPEVLLELALLLEELFFAFFIPCLTRSFLCFLFASGRVGHITGGPIPAGTAWPAVGVHGHGEKGLDAG